jgi:hypothetical protein
MAGCHTHSLNSRNCFDCGFALPRRLRVGQDRAVDTTLGSLNNPRVTRPEAVRRIKCYSAATGFVYQYYFYEMKKTRRGFSSGTEYIYMVSVDRQHAFPVRIFVNKDASKNWSGRAGRDLSGTEEYAVAKMRLFQAFDEIEGLAEKTLDLVVDDTNLEALLTQLDL